MLPKKVMALQKEYDYLTTKIENMDRIYNPLKSAWACLDKDSAYDKRLYSLISDIESDMMTSIQRLTDVETEMFSIMDAYKIPEV
jgi:hypothetical protein